MSITPNSEWAFTNYQSHWLLSMRRSSGFTPSSSWVTKPLILSLREHHGHYPKFMTKGEGGSMDWPVNWEICLSMVQYTSRIIAEATLNCLSISCSIFRQDFTSQLLPVKNLGLHLGCANCHLSCFTLSCKPPQYMLKVLAWWSQHDNIICKKQWLNPVVLKPDSSQAPTWVIKRSNSI